MSRQRLVTAGIIGLITGILGALSAVALLVWTPQVPEGQLSYPLTTGGFQAIQVWFAIHHIGLLIVLIGLAGSGATGPGRAARAGAWTAAAGMVLLSLTELLALRYADSDWETASVGVLGAAYGIATGLIAIGTIAAGIGVLRTGAWSGWHRWTPLSIGIGVFVIVTPGELGGFVTGRLGIGIWMLLFAALGWSLVAESRRTSAARQTATRQRNGVRS